MESIDAMGAFWPAARESESALAGRLTIGPDSSGKVHLVGEFDENALPPTDPGRPQNFTLHGWMGSKEVTLLNCSIKQTSRYGSRVNESIVRFDTLLRGGHIDHPVQFQSGRIRTSGAADWIGKRVVGEAVTGEGDRPADWLEYERPATMKHAVEVGELRLHYAYRHSSPGSTRSIDFEHWPVFEIEYPGLQDLRKAERDLGLIESLVSLCTGRVSTAMATTFDRPDIKQRSISGKEFPFPKDFEYIARSITPPSKKKQQHEFEMLLTYDELGGLPTIARFIDLAPQFRRSLDSLMSVMRAPQIYAENRFMNVAFAAESYHRDVHGGSSMSEQDFSKLRSDCRSAVDAKWSEWLDQKLAHANEKTFRVRLQELYETAGSQTLPFIDNPKKWISVLVGVRNNVTHLNSKKSDFDGGDLYYLSESLYALVRSNMLQGAGVSPDAIGARAGNDHLAWYAERLNATVSRLRKLI